MRYYITTTFDAVSKSAQEAIRRGTKPGTNYWWMWIVNYEDDRQAALQFSDDEEVPESCQPTVDDLPPSWWPPESPQRAAAEERQRTA